MTQRTQNAAPSQANPTSPLVLSIEALDLRQGVAPIEAAFAPLGSDPSPTQYQAHVRSAPFAEPLRFTLTRSDASLHGFQNTDLWTLTLDGAKLNAEFVWPFRMLRLRGFRLHADTRAALANGFQCWSESPLLGKDHLLAPEAFKEREVFGDAEFYPYAQRPGAFHSWSFSYSVLDGGTSNPFFAALDEDLFHCAFEFDLNAGSLHAVLDTQGIALVNMRSRQDRGASTLTLAALLVPRAESRDFIPLGTAADAWMDQVRSHERVARAFSREAHSARMDKVRGYTSWYLHYNNISHDLLARNLEAISQSQPWAVFQIDDGYQRQIGDWLTPSAGFPAGVAPLARRAKELGLKPGIWCAPFIVMENSDLFRAHPEWLLRSARKDPVLCGNHPLWGGKFYALDSEHPGVRQYVREVLTQFFEGWGFTFLKADFLYATARVGVGGFSRAARAARAHQFLHDICKEQGATFLSCGATLSSAYGRCDYARVGADVGESWENTEFGAGASREKVSTRGTLTNTLTRAFLNGAAFGNDPDVIIVREERQQMSQDERPTLAHVNALLGNLVFCSDDVSTYGAFEKNLHAAIARYFETANGNEAWRVASMRCEAGDGPSQFECYELRFMDNPAVLKVNLSDRAWEDVPARGFRLVPGGT